MLDIMRKHASSWIIRVTLGAIIVTFIFFFGYSSFRKGARGGRAGTTGAVAAKVDGMPVSASEFKFFFDRNFEQMKSSFEGKEVPDFARKLAQSSTLRQLIFREVALQQADELGIVIPDNELADLIKKGQTSKEGEFDPIAYRHNFLPYFKDHFGLDYEQFVRTDLRIASLEKIFSDVDREQPPKEDGEAAARSKWTFEIVTIDPNALVAENLVKTVDEAKAVAGRLAAANPKDWKRILKPLKIESKKAGPIGISERKALLDGNATLEDYGIIFALTAKNPVAARPIERSGKTYVVRLLEKTAKDDKESSEDAKGNFFMEWMSKRAAGAKVQDFMDKAQL